MLNLEPAYHDQSSGKMAAAVNREALAFSHDSNSGEIIRTFSWGGACRHSGQVSNNNRKEKLNSMR